jgi:hypothetical protein
MSSAGRCRAARRGLFSLVVGVLSCVVIAAPVSAFVSRRTHVEIVPLDGSVSFGSSTATCPSGQHVLFGGFRNGVAGMRRTASNRWTVYAFKYDVPPDSSPLSLSSFVYCGYGPVPSKATSTVEIRYRPDRDDASGSATARCPTGTVVVAGGFATPPHSTVLVTGLERVAADLWRVSAYPIGDGHAALTSIAYCGRGPAPKLVSQAIRNYVSGPVRATCPAGRQLAFGGAIVKPTYGAFLQTLRAKNQGTWTVDGIGPDMTALAYCR